MAVLKPSLGYPFQYQQLDHSGLVGLGVKGSGCVGGAQKEQHALSSIQDLALLPTASPVLDMPP